MGASVWFYIRGRDGTFRRWAQRSVNRFFDGEVRLSADDVEDGLVRYAQVYVMLEDRQPVAAQIHGFHQARVKHDGLLDKAHFQEIMALAGEATSGGFSLEPDHGVVRAEHRFAQRRLGHLSHWKPTDQEVKALQALVNARAKREIL